MRELTDLIAVRGKPGMIVSDNGTELTSNAVLEWCGTAKIDWHYTTPGKPTQNAFVESFNGRMHGLGTITPSGLTPRLVTALQRRSPLTSKSKGLLHQPTWEQQRRGSNQNWMLAGGRVSPI